MSELLVTLLRLSYLALLWVLVIAAIGVLRRDVFGTRVVQRRPKPAGASTPAARAAPAPTAPRGAVVGRPGPPVRVSTGAKTTATQLVVVDGAQRGTKIALTSSAVLIGRAQSCTLVLTDDFASSRHARVFPQQGVWWVEDLGSTNGTFVGEERLTEPRELPPEQPVRIGQTIFELRR